MVLSPAALLALWEAGRPRHRIDRALLLFAFAEPERNPDELADLPIGTRNLALLRLRAALFGLRLEAYADCPRCGERQTFDLDAQGLSGLPECTAQAVSADGYRFRVPTSRDIASLQGMSDAEEAAALLLRRCLLSIPDGTDDADGDLPADLLAILEPLLEAADPAASYALSFDCSCCGESIEQVFDVADYLWEELETYALQLAGQVHRLATAYHWSEREILALSASRRALYLGMLEQ